MAEVFDFKVRAQPSGQTTHRTIKTPFGDGYSQALGDGINTREDTWNLSARGQVASSGACAPIGQDVQAIKDFIDAHGGHRSFEWTDPNGQQGLWRCDGYATTKESPTVHLVSFTFYRVYMP